MNSALAILIAEAVKALFGFLTIIFTKKKAIDDKKIADDIKLKEESDALKEDMHKALLSNDNSAIVLCINRYKQLRQKAEHDDSSG